MRGQLCCIPAALRVVGFPCSGAFAKGVGVVQGRRPLCISMDVSLGLASLTSQLCDLDEAPKESWTSLCSTSN